MSLNIARSTPTTLMCGQGGFSGSEEEDRGSSVCHRPTRNKRGKKTTTRVETLSRKPQYGKTEYSPSLLMGGGISKKNAFVEEAPSITVDDGSFTARPSFSASFSESDEVNDATTTRIATKPVTPPENTSEVPVSLRTFLDAEAQASNDSTSNKGSAIDKDVNDSQIQNDNDDESSVPDDRSLQSLPSETEEVLTQLVEARTKKMIEEEKSLELPNLGTWLADPSDHSQLEDEQDIQGRGPSTPIPQELTTSSVSVLSNSGEQHEETSPWRFYSGSIPSEEQYHTQKRQHTLTPPIPPTPAKTAQLHAADTMPTPIRTLPDTNTSPWRFYSAGLSTMQTNQEIKKPATNIFQEGPFDTIAAPWRFYSAGLKVGDSKASAHHATKPQTPPLKQSDLPSKTLLPAFDKAAESPPSIETNSVSGNHYPTSPVALTASAGEGTSPWRFYSGASLLPPSDPSENDDQAITFDTASHLTQHEPQTLHTPDSGISPWRFYSAGLSTTETREEVQRPLNTMTDIQSNPATAPWRFYSAGLSDHTLIKPAQTPLSDSVNSATSSSTTSSVVSREIAVAPPPDETDDRILESYRSISKVTKDPIDSRQSADFEKDREKQRSSSFPLAISLCLLALCNIAAGYLAVFELHTLFPLDLFTGIAMVLMALSSMGHAPYSSFAVALYGIKTALFVCLMAPEDTTSLKHFIAESIDPRQRDPKDPRGEADDEDEKTAEFMEGLVVYEAANLFYVLLILTPHLLRSCSSRGERETLLQSTMSFLGMILCLCGFFAQALVVFDPLMMEGFLSMTDAMEFRGDTLNAILASVSECTELIFANVPHLSTKADLMDVGEAGIWVGVGTMNLVGGRQASFTRIFLTTAALALVLMITYHLRFDNAEISSLLPLDEEWFANFQSAANATFTRYNVETSNSSTRNALVFPFPDDGEESLGSVNEPAMDDGDLETLALRTWQGALISMVRKQRST